MKRSMITLLIGAALGIFACRYFLKGKPKSGIDLGNGLIPDSINTTQTTGYAYIGATKDLGHGYFLKSGDRVEGIQVGNGFEITKYINFPDYPGYVIVPISDISA